MEVKAPVPPGWTKIAEDANTEEEKGDIRLNFEAHMKSNISLN